MIKKSVFEDELIFGMQRELTNGFDKTAAMDDLVKGADYLQAAMEIFEEAGLDARAEQVLSILQKIAEEKHHDPHTKGLTPERMIENLKHHGIVFNLSNDGKADKLLDVELADDNDLEVSEELPEHKSFEDES